MFALLLLLFQNHAVSQDAEYEEIPITVRVQGVGGTDLNPLYNYQSNRLFLPITDIFQFLRLKAEPSVTLDTLSGFMVDESKQYLVDNLNKQIFSNGKIYPLKESDLIKTEFGLYLDHQLFGEIFGLFCEFNFRSLSVEIKPDFEIPVIREMRLQQFRKNVDNLKGETEVDTTLFREYHLLRFGMVDWAVSSTQSTVQVNDTRLWVGTGAELFGGEANILLNYSSRDGFNDRSQQYYWRWVNNQAKAVRQIRLGKISSSGIASVYDPLV
jgi:hypothetical protein